MTNGKPGVSFWRTPNVSRGDTKNLREGSPPVTWSEIPRHQILRHSQLEDSRLDTAKLRNLDLRSKLETRNWNLKLETRLELKYLHYYKQGTIIEFL